MILTDIDLGWLAGFLEGEGCFLTNSHGTPHVYPRIVVGQKQLEPLERCVKITGCGSIRWGANRTYGINELTWGPAASRIIMDLVYPLMSPRRKEQIDKVRSVDHTRRKLNA